jgi:lantibiotic modifying enzyme
MAQAQRIEGRIDRLTLTPELESRARMSARVVGERVARVTEFARIEGLQNHASGLAGGFPGLAVFAAGLDAAFPEEGWDRVAHRHISSAIQDGDTLGRLGPSLHDGWAGLVFAADLLSRDGRRYRGFLSQAESRLAIETQRLVKDVEGAPAPIAPPLIDVISGLSGVVAILLLRRGTPEIGAALTDALHALAGLARSIDGVPRASSPSTWGTPIVAGVDGPVFNLGMSHGIPGPIAALSLAFAAGARVHGQEMAIETLVAVLLSHVREDEWGPTWPHGAPVEVSGPRGPNGRMAWCYGTPGCARALWLAGVALDRPEWRELAHRAISAALRRPPRIRLVSEVTLCHGLSGILQIGIRFYVDTADERLLAPLSLLLDEVLTAFEPAAPFGYRSMDHRNRLRDDPGFLNGTAGVGLTLLSASTSNAPPWDRALLLR